MKKSIIILTILLAMVSLISCMGAQNATVSIEDQTTNAQNDTGQIINFHSSSLGLLTPPPCPDEMGRLLEARANAKLTEKIAEQIGSGNTDYGAFCGIVVNDDPRYSIFVAHPEKSKKLKIPPNSCKFIYTTNVPNKITVYNTKGDYTVMRVDKKGGAYNGRPYHYGIRVYTAGL